MPGLVAQYPVAPFTTPVNGDDLDAALVVSHDSSIASAHTSHDADSSIHFQSSTLAARPGAGIVGRKWITTDGLRVYYDTGAAWSEIAYLSLAAGGVVAGATTFSAGVVSTTGAFSGAVSTGALTVTGALLNTGAQMGRFEGNGGGAGGAGAGIEIYKGGIQSFNRTTVLPGPIQFDGTLFTFNGPATFNGAATFTTTLAVTGTVSTPVTVSSNHAAGTLIGLDNTNGASRGSGISLAQSGSIRGYFAIAGVLFGSAAQTPILWAEAGLGFEIYTNAFAGTAALSLSSTGQGTFRAGIVAGGVVNVTANLGIKFGAQDAGIFQGAVNTLYIGDYAAATVGLRVNYVTGLTSSTGGFSGALTGNVTGNLTGNVTGNTSGSSGSCTGNAATATALQTTRAINGVNFDGTAAITVTAAAGTLTGATLAAGVTASSLTSFGAITALDVGVAHVKAGATTAVGVGSATTIYTAVNSGGYAVVFGSSGGRVFCDTITWDTGTSQIFAISSTVIAGVPSGRTYSLSGSNIQLTMAAAATSVKLLPIEFN